VDLGYRYKRIAAGNAIVAALNVGKDYGINQVRVGAGSDSRQRRPACDLTPGEAASRRRVFIGRGLSACQPILRRDRLTRNARLMRSPTASLVFGTPWV
jgi:hypothetical protein